MHEIGPRTVLVTSLHTEETPEDAIDMLACDEDGAYLLRTPKLPLVVNGAGDAIAALFFAHYLRERQNRRGAGARGSAIFGVLAKTTEEGAREIAFITAQEEIVNPSRVFEAKQIGAMSEAALYLSRRPARLCL